MGFVDAIVTILLGILVWAHWPFNSDWVVGTLSRDQHLRLWCTA